MNNETDPLFLLYSVALAQLIVIVVGLIRKGRLGIKESLLLITFITSLFIIIAEFLLTWSGYLVAVPWMLGLSFPFQFLLAPVFLGMVISSDRRKFRSLDWFHLIPFLLILAYQFFYLPVRIPDKLLYYEQRIVTEEAFSSSEYILQVLLWALHLGLYLALVNWHMVSSKEKWKRTHRIIFYILSGVLILLFIHAGLLFFSLPYYALTYCILVGLLGILGFWMQVDILAPSNGRKSTEKYKNSGLSPAIIRGEKSRIEQRLKDGLLYLRPDLTLPRLADCLGLSSHHLSQVLNQGFGKSFSDFINEYRIDYARNLLRSPENSFTIEQVAYESGFNSRNSFHRAFKKIVSMSPTEFRARSRKEV